MTFTIDRSIWRCAHHGRGDTMLANRQGFMCCLGQLSCQLGVPYKAVFEKPSPNRIPKDHAHRLAMLLDRSGNSGQSQFAWDAMDINDDRKLSDRQREAKLAALFAEYGHEVRFEGEFAK